MNELVPIITATLVSHLRQRNYVRDVGRFATFLGPPPDTASSEGPRRFQLVQREAGMPVPTMNAILAAPHLFLTHTLYRPDLARRLVPMKQMRKLPVVLSRCSWV